MTTITPDHRLADLVTADPSLARALQRLGLDYCCGGRQTLEQACLARDLDPESVVEELIAASGPRAAEDWTTMGPVELSDHIETTHHRFLWEELPRLTSLVEKVRVAHGERHPELDEIAHCFDELRADLVPHLLKEERVLFPMIRHLGTATSLPELHCGSIRNPIAVMAQEHDRAGELLAGLRRLSDDYRPPADACASYAALYLGLEELEADTHLHIHKENNVLFPAMITLAAALGS